MSLPQHEAGRRPYKDAREAVEEIENWRQETNYGEWRDALLQKYGDLLRQKGGEEWEQFSDAISDYEKSHVPCVPVDSQTDDGED